MNERHTIQLPPEWGFPTPEQTGYLLRELRTEAPVEHVLYQQPVEVFAVRTTCYDVAYRLIESPARIVVVHLTWVGHTECEGHPTVGFDGSIPEFCDFFERQYAESAEHQKTGGRNHATPPPRRTATAVILAILDRLNTCGAVTPAKVR